MAENHTINQPERLDETINPGYCAVTNIKPLVKITMRIYGRATHVICKEFDLNPRGAVVNFFETDLHNLSDAKHECCVLTVEAFHTDGTPTNLEMKQYFGGKTVLVLDQQDCINTMIIHKKYVEIIEQERREDGKLGVPHSVNPFPDLALPTEDNSDLIHENIFKIWKLTREAVAPLESSHPRIRSFHRQASYDGPL
jgi:hypothetical protein